MDCDCENGDANARNTLENIISDHLFPYAEKETSCDVLGCKRPFVSLDKDCKNWSQVGTTRVFPGVL